jgi:Tol biopolymer transport system component
MLPEDKTSGYQKYVLLAVLLICFASITGSPALAQLDAPLIGPLLAFDTAAQDRIVIYDLGSGEMRTLNFGASVHRVWGFSPDGCRLLFTLTDGAGDSDIYTARLDGGDLRVPVRYETLPAGQWSAWEPQWQPNDSRIAFTLVRRQLNSDGSTAREYRIAWVNAEGGDPVFYSVSGDEHTARWSPDGAWLAYVSFEQRVAGADMYSTAVPTPVGAAPAPMLREADLWVVSADGERKLRLTNFDVGSVGMPRWSPDGSLIGFVYSPGPNLDQFWMIANAQDAIPTQLSSMWTMALDLTWLPDSTAMLAAVRGMQGVTENRLWMIPLLGNADTNARLYPDSGFDTLVYADYPRFSPDGRWLALRAGYQLTVLNVSDFSLLPLPDSLYGNTPPVWSPAAFAGEAACS